MPERFTQSGTDFLNADETSLPIPVGLDRSIRIQDLVEENFNGDGNKQGSLEKDLERFDAAREHWETVKIAYPPPAPFRFDAENPIMAAYFAKIKTILDKQKLALATFTPTGVSMANEDREKITMQCMRIARDVILILGPETYKHLKIKLKNAYFRELPPELIMTATARETMTFHKDTGKRCWYSNPVAWAKDCVLLLLNPEIVKHLLNHKPHISKKSRPDVEGWITKIEKSKPENKPKRRKSNIPDLETLNLKPEDIDEEMAQSIIATIRKTKIDTHDRKYNASYHPRFDSYGGSATRMISFLNRFFENYEGDRNRLQCRMYIAAEKIARAMQEQKKPAYERSPRDMSKVLEAINEFKTMALKTDTIAKTTDNNKIYKVETDIKRNIPVIRIIQQNPPKLICHGKTLEELAAHPGITQKDLEIAERLLRPPENEEEKMRNFKINEQWDTVKFKKKDLGPIRVLYTLTHFLATTLPKLFPAQTHETPEKPEDPPSIEAETRDKIVETLRHGGEA